jgi:hypothetical protein
VTRARAPPSAFSAWAATNDAASEQSSPETHELVATLPITETKAIAEQGVVNLT